MRASLNKVAVCSEFFCIITLSNIDDLTCASAFAGLDAQRLLHNDSAPTALEVAEGNLGAAQASFGGPALGASLASLAAAFDRHYAPARQQLNTRLVGLEHWRLVLTWAVARRRGDAYSVSSRWIWSPLMH